jgi:hypothetical protein
MPKEAAPQSVFLKLTHGLVIDGRIAPAGSVVEVTDVEAREYLYRGKADLATEADYGIAAMCAGIVAAAENGKEEATEADGAPSPTAEEPAE